MVAEQTLTPADDAERRAEQALVRRCVDGDGLAWRTLFDRHYPKVERLVRALGIADAEAEDLAQEILLIVYKNLAKFRGESRLGTWIARLAAREAIRSAKRRRLRRSFLEIFAREKTAPAPTDFAENEASRRLYLQQLLGRLSPDRRFALVLFEIEGLGVAEIAELAGCKENTVWTRIHRARVDLEKMVEERS